MPQAVTGGAAEADHVAGLLGERAGDDDGQRADGQDQQHTVKPSRIGTVFQIGRPSRMS